MNKKFENGFSNWSCVCVNRTKIEKKNKYTTPTYTTPICKRNEIIINQFSYDAVAFQLSRSNHSGSPNILKKTKHTGWAYCKKSNSISYEEA